MQEIAGYMRRAIEEYDMIQDGDKIALGISGGKDSVAMLAGFCKLKRFLPIRFELVAVTIDPCFSNTQTDYSTVSKLCETHGVPHIIRRSDLGDIIFNQRQESNPCSLCARMRRGMIHDMTKENGCNKLALGHNADDAVETFMMNLFQEGRVGCFQPVTYLSRKDLTMIRPLAFAPERVVRNAVVRNELPVVKSACPVDGCTSREGMKNWLAGLEQTEYPGLRKKLLGAIRRGHISGW